MIKFEERIRELVVGMPDLAEIIASLLDARQKLRDEVRKLHRKLLSIVREDKVCRRLMTIFRVSALSCLWHSLPPSTIQHGSKSSKAVWAALGLTPILNQSGAKAAASAGFHSVATV